MTAPVSDLPKLDDGDRALMRECPFDQYVPRRGAGRFVAGRLKRISRLTLAHLIRGTVSVKHRDGHIVAVSLTTDGRAALGYLPEPPAS